MGHPPTVSVIVAVHDVEDLVDRCVDSLRRQGHEDLEIILVDDGSRDGSGARCDVHARADPRVRVLHRANGGLSDARNAGLAVAAGAYVLFVDGDDWVHPDLVRTLVAMVGNRPGDVAISSFVRTSGPVPPSDVRAAPVHHLDRDAALMEWVGARHTVMTISCGKLVPRRFFDAVEFPVGRLHEDEFTTHRLLHQAREVHLTEAPLYYYWQRPDSIMGSGYSSRRGADAVAAAREQASFLEDIGLPAGARVARAQLLRRLARLYAFASSAPEPGLRDRTRAELVDVARSVRNDSSPLPVRALAAAYAVAPDVASRLHSAHGRLAGHPQDSRHSG